MVLSSHAGHKFGFASQFFLHLFLFFLHLFPSVDLHVLKSVSQPALQSAKTVHGGGEATGGEGDATGTGEGGEGEAANFARRSPYPMINLLRTPQVRDAQKGIPTGAVYDVNERNMATVGTETLREMLQARDWTGLEGRSWEPHPTRAKLETKARQNF